MTNASMPSSIPQHIAIIMDSNRRWVRKLGIPRALMIEPAAVEAVN